MSTVAFKDGVLAADSKAYGGKGHNSPGCKRKVHRLADGTRVGVVSAVLGEPERFLAWLKSGAGPEAWIGDKPDLRALMIKPNGEAFLFEDSLWPSGPIACEMYAIGSGEEYAMGAMSAGATAVEAVEIAMALDSNSGCDVMGFGPDGTEIVSH